VEGYITAERIANSIMQQNSFEGTHILVEGVKDIKVYTKFFQKEQVKLTQTFGKYKLREVFDILSLRGFNKKIAIRDADFLRLKDNRKFEVDYAIDIYPTDGHDSEVMMLAVNTLEDLLAVTVEQDKLDAFEKRIGESFKSRVIKMSYLIGCLRLANKRSGLGLLFKPAKQGGNRIKFKKFVCDKEFNIDTSKMIHVISEYSKNRDTIVCAQQVITDNLDKVLMENHDVLEVINGHDVAEITCILSSIGVKSKSDIFQHPDKLEEALAMCFDRNKFCSTNLYRKINDWKVKNDLEIFFSM
ncbi:hypothetical protein AI2616V1_3115, partial [Serratia marcescens]